MPPGFPAPRLFAGLALFFALWLALLDTALAAPAAPYPPFALEPDSIRRAIDQAAGTVPAASDLTGITVPHHLLAADLMAMGYRAASGGHYRRILVLFPDHFFKSGKPFATTQRDFDTLFGPVATDAAAARALLADDTLFEASDLFQTDHGLQAQLPFIRHHFGDAKIVPIAVSIRSRRADWDRALALLLPLLDAQTLIVQSTDFSHYLTPHASRLHDQETLNIMAAGDLDALTRLRQPDHIDSLGSLYLQMRLQKEKFGVAPLVIANRNAQGYFRDKVERTTSYVVAVYGRQPEPFRSVAGSEVAYFAGDTLLGRRFTPLLADEDVAEELRRRILALTGGRPLVVNIEGVMLDEIPRRLRFEALSMPNELALDWLKQLNVVAVGIANNHVDDLGPAAFAEMKAALVNSGIRALGHGEAAAFGRFSIVALTDLSSSASQRTQRIGADDIERVCGLDVGPPLVAFVHWGEEGRNEAAERERQLAEDLRGCAVPLVIGAHSHRAATGFDVIAGGETLTLYSLGNFLFDQGGDIASGAMVELRLFDQGTFFARLQPLPNLYDLARGVDRSAAASD